MTVLVTADLHLGDNPRDAYRHHFMERLWDICYDQGGVDEILILGDITEEKDRHGAWLVNKIVDHFYHLSGACSVTILRGNHDYIDINAPFFRFLKRLKNVRWIDKVTDNLTCNIGKLLFLPHTRNYQKDWNGIKFDQFDWIFAHNTFEGADVGHGRKLNGIPTDMFPEDNVISGDIHIPQTLGPVTYVGAPYTVDFGDDYKPRVLLINKHHEVKSIPVVGPMKRLVELESVADLFEKKAWKSKLNEGDILKVRVQLPASEMPQWTEVRRGVLAWGEKNGYVIHTVQPVKIDTRMVTAAAKRRLTTRTDKQLLETYAKQRKVDDRTLETGLTIMEKT